VNDTNGFKKFENKVLAGAVTLVIALTSAVWAITWSATDKKAEEARAEVEKVKVHQASDAVKIVALEQNLGHMRVTLEKILEELRRR